MFKTHRSYELTTGVKNNTIAVLARSNLIEVIYHKTIVVTAHKKQLGWEAAIDNSGFDTVSTRAVINRALEQIDGFEDVFLERVKGQTLLNFKGDRKAFENARYL